MGLCENTLYSVLDRLVKEGLVLRIKVDRLHGACYRLSQQGIEEYRRMK